MPQEVEAHLRPLVAGLGRELRASIDFMSINAKKPSSKILISGAASRSKFLVQLLQTELAVPMQGLVSYQKECLYLLRHSK